MLQNDPFLLGELGVFVVVFLVGAVFLALGAAIAAMQGASTFKTAMNEVFSVSFVADYIIVLIAVLLPAAWVASIGITQKGIAVFIASVGSFFTTGLAIKHHAKHTVAQANAAAKRKSALPGPAVVPASLAPPSGPER